MTDNYVDFLEESAKSPSVPFMEFLRSQAPDTLHMFVEGGGDIAFYRNFVLRYFKKIDKIHIHPCSAKYAVYETRQAIRSRANQPEWADRMILLFFVDKDLSDILGDTYDKAPEIFVTDYYSVENYVVSSDMLGIVLSDMFSYSGSRRPTPDEVREINVNFSEQLGRFYEFIKPVMIWGIYHKRNKTVFEFEDVALNKLFGFENGLELVKKASSPAVTLSASLDQMCKITTSDYSSEVVSEIDSLLDTRNPKLYVRGKFEMWFFHKFMEQVAKMLKKRTHENIRYKENLMSQNDLMVSLGPRVHPIPPSLARFLSDNIRQRRRIKRQESRTDQNSHLTT